MKTTTICFLIRNKEICLGMKKRGFGKDKWNGFGGKVGDKEEHKNETVEESVIREAAEEFSIEPKKIEEVAQIYFKFPHKPEWDQHSHIFLISTWTGEPTESEEMLPQWFEVDNLPFEKMWWDDKFWLPRVLSGEKLIANFEFDEHERVTNQEIRNVDNDFTNKEKKK